MGAPLQNLRNKEFVKHFLQCIFTKLFAEKLKILKHFLPKSILFGKIALASMIWIAKYLHLYHSFNLNFYV
jgi:hypothetical protein